MNEIFLNEYIVPTDHDGIWTYPNMFTIPNQPSQMFANNW